MIVGILLMIISLFYFQIDRMSEYFLQFKYLSPEIIFTSVISFDYIQLIRLFTCHLFHSDLNHYLVNSTALISHGLVLEKYFNNYSKLTFMKLIIALMYFSSLIYLILSYFICLIYKESNIYHISICGLSSVLFGLQFIQQYLTTKEFYNSVIRILFYILYIHLVFPGSSTLGHFSGLLSAMFLTKYLDF